MQVPILAWLLQGIPECLASTALVMIVSTGRLQWDKILMIGLCQAVLVYLVRLLPITYGVHTILLIFSLAVLVSTIGKVSFLISLLSSIFAIFVIFISEFSAYWLISRSRAVTHEEMVSSVSYWIVMGLPQIVVLSLLVYIFKVLLKGKRLQF